MLSAFKLNQISQLREENQVEFKQDKSTLNNLNSHMAKDKRGSGYNEIGYAYLKTEFFNLLETTSCHGIPNAVRGKHLLQKIVWILIFLSFLVYSIYMVISLFLDFLEFNVLVRYQITQNFENLVFPAVTICNVLPFDFSNKTNLNSIYNYFAKTSSPDTYFYTADKLTLCSTADPVEILSRYPEVKNAYAYSMSKEKMIISCFYNGVRCLSEDWTEVHSSQFGRCVVFNKVGDRKVRKAGFIDGLQVELFLGESQYQPCWNFNTGAVIAVHNQSVQAMVTEEGEIFYLIYFYWF